MFVCFFEGSFLPSFLPSFLLPSFFLPSSFLPSFLPIFLLSHFPTFLPSFLPSYLLFFLPSFLPTFLILPSFLPSLIPSFLSPSFFLSLFRFPYTSFYLYLHLFYLSCLSCLSSSSAPSLSFPCFPLPPSSILHSHLCCFPLISSGYPDFPRDFFWWNHHKNINYKCVHVDEPGDTTWRNNNYLCYKVTKMDVGLRWSSKGPIPNMKCTQMTLNTERTRQVWKDNYLCVPRDSIFSFTWSTRKPSLGETCMRIRGGKRKTVYYLCGVKRNGAVRGQ